jgi:hypothetical protein
MNRDQINDEVFAKVAEILLLIKVPAFKSDEKVDWALQQLYIEVGKHLEVVISNHACPGCGTPYCTSCR